MTFSEKLAIKIAWLLPRNIAKWAFVRVATDGSDAYPAEQPVGDCLKRWEG